MSIEEASKKVFEDLLTRFEKDTNEVFLAPEDLEALADLVNDWRNLGDRSLRKLSMNQPWNMPLYFASRWGP